MNRVPVQSPEVGFSTLKLAVRAQSGSGTINVAPRSEDGRCSNAPDVEVSGEWTEAEVNISDACPDTEILTGITISFASAPMDLMLDEIRFE